MFAPANQSNNPLEERDPIPTSEEIEAAATRMKRHRKRAAEARTLGENVEHGFELQRTAWEIMQSNPEAMAAYKKRNHHKRRYSEVERIERLTLGLPPEQSPPGSDDNE